MAINITDDEVVALAVGAQGIYAGALPTVDVGSATALSASAWRGQRSLVVRDLIDQSGNLAPEVAEVASSTAGAQTLVTVYIANDALDRVGWGVAFSFYPSPSGWLAEGVSPSGIHQFSVMGSDDVVASLRGLVESALATPAPQDSEPASWMVVAVVQEGLSSVLAAREGTLQTTALQGEVEKPAWTDAEPQSVAAWLEEHIPSLG